MVVESGHVLREALRSALVQPRLRSKCFELAKQLLKEAALPAPPTSEVKLIDIYEQHMAGLKRKRVENGAPPSKKGRARVSSC